MFCCVCCVSTLTTQRNEEVPADEMGQYPAHVPLSLPLDTIVPLDYQLRFGWRISHDLPIILSPSLSVDFLAQLGTSRPSGVWTETATIRGPGMKFQHTWKTIEDHPSLSCSMYPYVSQPSYGTISTYDDLIFQVRFFCMDFLRTHSPATGFTTQ